MRNIWPARFCPLRVPLHRTRPPLISLSGHRFNQEIKWGAVGHRLARSRPTSLNRGSTDVSTPGTWVTSRFGLVITIGGALATVAAFVGYFGVGRGVEELVDVGNEVAASGGMPTADQQARIDRLSAALETHGKIDLALLLLAVTAMATARYW